MFGNPAMQNLLQQMQANPSMQSSMMQSPFMQQMMNQMMSNPQIMTSVFTKFLSFSYVYNFIHSFPWFNGPKKILYEKV